MDEMDAYINYAQATKKSPAPEGSRTFTSIEKN